MTKYQNTMTPEAEAEWKMLAAAGTLFGAVAGPPLPPKPKRNPPEHGSATMYGYHGCRCPECRRGNLLRKQESDRRRASRPVPDHVHGTENGYTNYSCRCRRCKDNWAAVCRARYLKSKENRLTR